MIKGVHVVLISKNYRDIAKKNGISITTLYGRINRSNFTIQDAINMPLSQKTIRQKNSPFKGIARSKGYVFKLPLEYEEKFIELLEQSNLTSLDFSTEIIIQWLDKQKNK